MFKEYPTSRARFFWNKLNNYDYNYGPFWLRNSHSIKIQLKLMFEFVECIWFISSLIIIMNFRLAILQRISILGINFYCIWRWWFAWHCANAFVCSTNTMNINLMNCNHSLAQRNFIIDIKANLIHCSCCWWWWLMVMVQGLSVGRMQICFFPFCFIFIS